MAAIIERQQCAHVKAVLDQNLVAIVYGARQVGKTTMAQSIMEQFDAPLYLNCDDPAVVAGLTGSSASQLKSYLGSADLVVIDEADMSLSRTKSALVSMLLVLVLASLVLVESEPAPLDSVSSSPGPALRRGGPQAIVESSAKVPSMMTECFIT